MAAVYSDLGIMLWSAGDRDAAKTATEHVLELRRETGDVVGQAWALTALAIQQSDEIASDAVVAQLRQAIALDSAAGAQAHRGFTLYSLSDVLRIRGELPAARATCAEAQAAYGRVNDPASRTLADFECAQIALDMGDVAAARDAAATARATALRRGDTMTVANADLLDGQIAMGERRGADAASAFGRAETEFKTADMVTGEAIAASLLALSEAALDQPRARDAAAARAVVLRSRITERQEVIAADIALAQLRGETADSDQAVAALEVIAADARARGWMSWVLEAKLAEVQVLGHRSNDAGIDRRRKELAARARSLGFGWVLRRLSA
jgi:hypothetical protein